LHDDPGLGALHDQHAVLAAQEAGGDPGVGQHSARDDALVGGFDLLAGHLGVVLERRTHHVVAHPRRRRTVGQPAVVDRVDLTARPLDALDHLELHLQGAHQPIEVRNDDVIGLTGLHHLDRPQKPRPPRERKLATHIDLLERVDDPVALVFAPRLGLGELRLR
jgi:hypothetical protein